MKKTLRILTIGIMFLSMSTLVYAMGAKPEVPEGPAPEEYNELAGDMTVYALAALKDTLGNEIAMTAFLPGASDDGFTEIGEFNGTKVSVKPSLTAPMGLTIRLEFDNAEIEVPVEPTDPNGEQKMVGTISSGVMDITIGYENIDFRRTMLVVQINTPETLVLDNEKETTIEFQDFTFAYNMAKFTPIGEDKYTISGKIIVNGVEVDIAQIMELIGKLKG